MIIFTNPGVDDLQKCAKMVELIPDDLLTPWNGLVCIVKKNWTTHSFLKLRNFHWVLITKGTSTKKNFILIVFLKVRQKLFSIFATIIRRQHRCSALMVKPNISFFHFRWTSENIQYAFHWTSVIQFS